MAFYINNHLNFIDGFQFMSSSLAKLADNLLADQFIYTKEYFTEQRQFRLMKEKGVYPYNYMDSFSKFNDTELPKREDFSSLDLISLDLINVIDMQLFIEKRNERWYFIYCTQTCRSL